MTIQQFENLLRKEDYAENTILAYQYALKEFRSRFREVNRMNLKLYKLYLIASFRPQTVNLRIQGINKFLEYSGKPEWKLKTTRVPIFSFCNNVISNEDYAFFIKRLKKETDLKWYFAVRYMAATGARVSELVQMKVENVREGFFDVYSKGGKYRRLYIPGPLRAETLDWIDRDGGYLFMNKNGGCITPRGIASQLRHYAIQYGMDPHTVHPHAFRHFYAKNFLDRHNDLALLADLLGHRNLSTTRIYLRRSSQEQQQLIDRIVVW